MTSGIFYLLCLAAAILLGGGCLLVCARRALPGHGATRYPLLCLALGLLGARLFYFLVRSEYLIAMYGWGRLWRLDILDLAFGGAVAGLLLAGLIAARFWRQAPGRMLDLLTPPALLTLILARLGEYFVDFGQGAYVAEPARQFFPLAVRNTYGEWYYAVFMLEALIALLILLRSLRRRGQGGEWQMALGLLLLGQILCESLRADTLRWGFVKAQQLFCALGLAALLSWQLRRSLRAGGTWRRLAWRPLLFILGLAAVIGIEFALDKWQEMPQAALYALLCLSLLGLGLAVFGPRARPA
ncbi:MAG: prolipoprotein diacylglyceryl transferase family protein [Christensenellales bacterium]